MKIETKLTFNNMKKNIKRTIYTTISISLCAFLIITTILVATSISTGFQESIASKYNDYHWRELYQLYIYLLMQECFYLISFEKVHYVPVLLKRNDL